MKTAKTSRSPYRSIWIFSSFFLPDDGPGARRATKIAESLAQDKKNFVTVFTISPHRYETSVANYALRENQTAYKTIRYNVRATKNKKRSELAIFLKWILFLGFHIFREQHKPGLIFATSSKFGTTLVATVLAKFLRVPIALDVRDIFSDSVSVTIKSQWAKKLVFFLKYLEKKVYQTADHINIISPGFRSTFVANGREPDSYYTNGIPDLFEYVPPKSHRLNSQKRYQIVYAGNIGHAQALHKLLAINATQMAHDISLNIYGNGSKEPTLRQILNDMDGIQINLCSMVDKPTLKQIYADSDALLLHLDDQMVFETVIPSKLFEYAASNKPIICGVRGWLRQFIENNLDGCFCFDPCDFNQFMKAVDRAKQSPTGFEREKFKREYNENEIICRFSDQLKNLAK